MWVFNTFPLIRTQEEQLPWHCRSWALCSGTCFGEDLLQILSHSASGCLFTLLEPDPSEFSCGWHPRPASGWLGWALGRTGQILDGPNPAGRANTSQGLPGFVCCHQELLITPAPAQGDFIQDLRARVGYKVTAAQVPQHSSQGDSNNPKGFGGSLSGWQEQSKRGFGGLF